MALERGRRLGREGADDEIVVDVDDSYPYPDPDASEVV